MISINVKGLFDCGIKTRQQKLLNSLKNSNYNIKRHIQTISERKVNMKSMKQRRNKQFMIYMYYQAV